MTYRIERTNQFKRSFKKCIKRGLDAEEFKRVIALLASTGTLPPTYKPHKLSGKYKSLWECHIQPDWLLIWEQRDREMVLLLIDTGTHSDIFG